MEFLNTIAQWRTPFLDNLFLALTKLGEESIVIVAVALLYWCISKRIAYGLGFAYFFSGITVNTLKITCRIDRPWILDPSFQAVEAAKANASSYSFPSGHTQSATALYGTLGLTVKNGWLKALFLLFIPIVGFSRMYLGVHTPADVLTSLAVTGAFAVIFSVLSNKELITNKFTLIVGLVLTFFGIGALGYAISLYDGGIIDYDYASDISKMVGAAIGFALGCTIEKSCLDFDTKTKHFWQQLVKVVVGIAVTLGLKSGIKPLFAMIDDQSLLFDAIRYGIVILWVVLIWPAIFSKLFNNKETAPEEVEAVESVENSAEAEEAANEIPETTEEIAADTQVTEEVEAVETVEAESSEEASEAQTEEAVQEITEEAKAVEEEAAETEESAEEAVAETSTEEEPAVEKSQNNGLWF